MTKQARVLTDRELQRLLDFVAKGKNAKRNRAILMCQFLAGMRIGEVSALRIFDVLASDGSVVIHLLNCQLCYIAYFFADYWKVALLEQTRANEYFMCFGACLLQLQFSGAFAMPFFSINCIAALPYFAIGSSVDNEFFL